MIEKKLNLELYFEDLYFAPIKEKCPISSEIWQSWYEKWLNILNPQLSSLNLYEVSLRLTDDAGIKELNGKFRYKNESTDVLSFAALEDEMPFNQESEPLYLGDIIISVETAKRQAQQQQHSLTIELAWLSCHGFLHLLGWDHPDDETLTQMLIQQEILLKKVGILIN